MLQTGYQTITQTINSSFRHVLFIS